MFKKNVFCLIFLGHKKVFGLNTENTGPSNTVIMVVILNQNGLSLLFRSTRFSFFSLEFY
jgi:hypothetical protein